MLRQRIITALVLLAVVVGGLLFLPLHYFSVAILVLVYLMSLEWGKLSGISHSTSISLYALFISVINMGFWYFSDDIVFWPSPSWPLRFMWDPGMIILSLSVVAVFISLFIVIFYSVLRKWWATIFTRCLLGAMLLPAFFVALVSIRNIAYLEDSYVGAKLLLLMFFIIWSADTGAYFVGKYFGRRALASNLSPNKTWEGALGGVLLSILVAWGASVSFGLSIQNSFIYFIVIASLAALSVFGDLFESALKRETGYKDSGNLLPGHGGLLDRLDSTIVVAPVYFLSFSYLGWF